MAPICSSFRIHVLPNMCSGGWPKTCRPVFWRLAQARPQIPQNNKVSKRLRAGESGRERERERERERQRERERERTRERQKPCTCQRIGTAWGGATSVHRQPL
ncbi:unnamed protein product [Polarella glacialis]|uniref:Uncharacterized protein n=1 Tax=Polarella glacialis TaxID=89957 RepID=A0A813IT87_POLGL|nr:unnamed protein product [Polarella glacialis]